MTRIAVFAYGSLVEASSASRTIGRQVPPPLPARLEGWSRRWSLVRDNLRSEKTFAIEPGGMTPPWVLGLNVEPGGALNQSAEPPNGALIEVEEAELERLDEREMRYDRVDVTDAIDGPEGFDLIVTYSAKREHHAPRTPPGAVILASYARVVEAGFTALGEGRLQTYRETTDWPAVEIVESSLIRDRIPPGNPRDW